MIYPPDGEVFVVRDNGNVEPTTIADAVKRGRPFCVDRREALVESITIHGQKAATLREQADSHDADAAEAQREIDALDAQP